MNGFAVDLAGKSSSPHVALGYFGLDQLPVFKVLAEQYGVCDQWFAALRMPWLASLGPVLRPLRRRSLV